MKTSLNLRTELLEMFEQMHLRGNRRLLQRAERLWSFVESGQELLGPSEHLTASGLVVDPQKNLVLLVLNPDFKRWLQPGGHVKHGEMPWQTAHREISEETTLTNVTLASRLMHHPIDICTHDVGPNIRGCHRHHDLRFLFIGDSDAGCARPAEEALGAGWVRIEAVPSETIQEGVGDLLERAWQDLDLKCSRCRGAPL